MVIFQYITCRDKRCIANPPGYIFSLFLRLVIRGAPKRVLSQLAQGGGVGNSYLNQIRAALVGNTNKKTWLRHCTHPLARDFLSTPPPVGRAFMFSARRIFPQPSPAQHSTASHNHPLHPTFPSTILFIIKTNTSPRARFCVRDYRLRCTEKKS